MNTTSQSLSRLIIVFIAGVMLVSGCSNSGSPQFPDETMPNETIVDTADVENSLANDDVIDATNQTPASAVESAGPIDTTTDDNVTRIQFDITVPEYQSDSLQVRLIWGGEDLSAMWIVDETWMAAADFPTDTQNQLSVTFSDNNGITTLASYETPLLTGSGSTQTYTITAEQFSTDQWDDDADGISNLDELRADHPKPVDSSTESAAALQPVSASIELMADKTFRISWEPDNAANYYHVLENPDGISGYTDVSGELDATTEYYDHRVALHKRFNARYIVQACNVSSCVTSAQQLIEGTLEAAIGYIKASNTDLYDYFGGAVSVSADGKTLAVGARNENSAATGVNADQYNDLDYFDYTGAVYVFSHSNKGWRQQAYLKASNTEADDQFGYSVSLSSDGNTLIVGAPGEKSAATGINGDQNNNAADASAGAVYVFTRSSDNWQQQAYLKASNTRGKDFANSGEHFGHELSLSADGNTLAVSAPYEDSPGTGVNGNQIQDDNPYTRNTGAVYVFQRNNNVWQQQAYIKSDITESRSDFGRVLTLSADGNTLAVSAYDKITGEVIGPFARGPDATDFYGAVYVYARTDGNWTKQAFLRSNTDHWVSFGEALGLSANGNVLAISIPSKLEKSVQMFERVDGSWEYQSTLRSNNDDDLEGFGKSLSLSADGSTLAVGAPNEDRRTIGIQGYQGDEYPEKDSGAVYVFTRPDGVWQQLAYVKPSNTKAGSLFGSVISLSANGDTMAVGASEESSATTGINGDQYGDPEAAVAAGAVYLY